ncbi:hypothetical protein U1Q18_028012 [Sarracenia purpurea var. burkii]
MTSPTTCADQWRTRTFGSLPSLIEIIENLKVDLEANRLPVSWSYKDLDGTLKTILKLHENINLCNPTVLDRINSLVEPHGSITVNECGSIDGKPLVLHPHPKFWMFLPVDPSYGEVSRAMQNRGFPIGTMVDSMAKAHLYAKGKGKDIIAHAIISYLSVDELYKFESSPGYSWCLPGGWPTPLKSPVEQALSATGYVEPYLVDMKILHVVMFPNSAQEITAQYDGQTENDLTLTGKRFMFTTNWRIEHATENDLELYLGWFSCFSSRFDPFCNFFSSFLNLLKNELKHHMWNCIVHYRHELLSHH